MKRKKLGATKRRKKAVETKPESSTEPTVELRAEGNRSRHIPAEVRRGVVERDGLQCAFVSENGRRCSETEFLEFHHEDPHGKGGPPTKDNIGLRCRAHNGYAAEKDYGAAFMARRKREARERAGQNGTRSGPQDSAGQNVTKGGLSERDSRSRSSSDGEHSPANVNGGRG